MTERSEGVDVALDPLVGPDWNREGLILEVTEGSATNPTVARLNTWWIDNGGGACSGARYDAALMAYHAGLRDAADEIKRLRDALARIVTEVSDELPGDTPPTGIQTLAHTVAVIATTALTPNAQAHARPAEGGSVACSALLGEHVLPNGRRYRVTDTGKPYEAGEYPSGGLHIAVWLNSQQWGYVDNAPDEGCVRNFLLAASRLTPNAKVQPRA